MGRSGNREVWQRSERRRVTGDEGVGKSGDLAKGGEEKDNGRRGKKMTEERGKKKDDGGRKKEIDGKGNHYI